MEESPQEKMLRKMFQLDEISDFTKISQSYQDYLLIIDQHLKTIYEDRAEINKCINTYFNSSEYKNNCHNGKCIDNIKLLKPEDIVQMLKDEDKYSTKIDDVIRYLEYSERSIPNNNEDAKKYAHKFASIFGFLPVQNIDDLFHWRINKNNISQDELEHLYKKIADNINLLNAITDIQAKMLIPGFQLHFNHVGCVMTQKRGKYFYRGENAFYKSSKASLFRKKNNLPTSIRTIVDHLRLMECWNFLDQFSAIKYWPLKYCAINYMALAQHYGFLSPMIDLTSDLKTALFFACCKFDKDQKKWCPLQKNEIENADSREDIANIGGDSRYGILYRSPTEITDMIWTLSDKNASYNIITPIGYQPFMRCSNQHSYMMLTKDDSYDLLCDPIFDVYKFRLDEEYCKWIYEEMDCGNKVYPNDDIPDISQEIEEINKTSIFSETVFQNEVKTLKVTQEGIEKLLHLLEKNGFLVMGKMKFIDTERLKQINIQYSVDEALKKINIEPVTSPMMIVYGNTGKEKQNKKKSK